MRNVEEELKIKKVDIDNLEIPEDLELRLRNALNSAVEQVHEAKVKKSWFIRHKVMAAALLLFVLLSIYNYDVLAYYGKKILGYDEVTYGSIKELNEMGMGQEIDKTYKFKNGTEVSLDGVMLDDNKLVVMYSVKGESEDEIQKLSLEPLEGIFGRYHMSGGHGIMNDAKNEIRWIQEFESPFILDRTLNFVIASGTKDVSKGEVGRISFKLDMNKAVKRVVKSDINQVIEFQGAKYYFTTLSATPMSVIVQGKIEAASEKDKKLFSPEDFKDPRRNLHLELSETYIKDGMAVTEKLQGGMSSMGSGSDGIRFECGFNGLKPDVKQLVLSLVRTEDMRIIDKKININSETKNVRVVPETEELIIKDVREEGGNTVVTFSAENDVAFGPALMIKDVQAKELSKNVKTAHGIGNGRIEKTYVFEGNGKDMSLLFKTLSHETYINKEITIYQGK